MQFDFLGKLQEMSKNAEKEINNNTNIDNDNISQTEIELAQKLDAVEEFSIDRFEEDMIVLENRKNGEKININKDKLPRNLKEGDIIKRINGKYFLDKQGTMSERDRIKNKMNNLWK